MGKGPTGGDGSHRWGRVPPVPFFIRSAKKDHRWEVPVGKYQWGGTGREVPVGKAAHRYSFFLTISKRASYCLPGPYRVIRIFLSFDITPSSSSSSSLRPRRGSFVIVGYRKLPRHRHRHHHQHFNCRISKTVRANKGKH